MTDDSQAEASFEKIPSIQVNELVRRYCLTRNNRYPVKLEIIETHEDFKLFRGLPTSEFNTYRFSGNLSDVKSILVNLKIIDWNSYDHKFQHYRPKIISNRRGEEIAMTVTIETTVDIAALEIFEENNVFAEEA